MVILFFFFFFFDIRVQKFFINGMKFKFYQIIIYKYLGMILYFIILNRYNYRRMSIKVSLDLFKSL